MFAIEISFPLCSGPFALNAGFRRSITRAIPLATSGRVHHTCFEEKVGILETSTTGR